MSEAAGELLHFDVVIPARDEETNIPPLFDALDALREALQGHESGMRLRHVIVADNGSTDGTPRLAEDRGARVVTEPQRGYGAACLRGLAAIDGHADPPPQVVAFLDADLADDPAALSTVLGPLAANTADLVIGSRIKQAEPGALSIVQRFGNGLACALIRLFTGRRYSDLGPLRAVRWSTFRTLGMADRTWGWTVEMQMKAALMDVRIAEVDVPYRRRRSGRSKISGTVRGVLTAGTKILVTIFTLWWTRRRWTRRNRDEAALEQR